MRTSESLVARRIRVRGLVQGVGFRPSVHRLATGLGLTGWVCNDDMGVLIHLEGPQSDLDAFLCRLPAAIPSAARVESVVQEPALREEAKCFRICASATRPAWPLRVRVPVDRAICTECRADVLNHANRRHCHPFATCTRCGPRYSIIREMPYERLHTSMSGYRMCSECESEYQAPPDRRFHAEPIACLACGPCVWFCSSSASDRGWHALLAAADALKSGNIVALKGLGGYQLLVRADSEDAVSRLRQRKRRPTKPFAVMVSSIEAAENLAHICDAERNLLLSAANPIVLLESRHRLAAGVAPGLRWVGVLLPTTPLHLFLLRMLDFPIVATSGNQCDDPIEIDTVADSALAAIADGYLDHDRQIVRRVDDSVVRVIDERPMVTRMARGFAPFELPMLERWAGENSIPSILAVGGQQKNALALWTGAQAILAQHLGDMDHPKARRAFGLAVKDLIQLYGCEPSAVACDLHPDYFTTRWAQMLSLPVIPVQHHHAHAVACMTEHGLLDRHVIGVIFDGTGFGADGTVWGGEILCASMSEFERVASLDLFGLPGGEAAVHQPNRIALSLLAETFGLTAVPTWLLERIGLTENRARVLLAMIDRHINSPRTSSVGRLFDGVAALVLKVTSVSYEGEAALLLENAVNPREESAYPIHGSVEVSGVNRGDWRSLIRCLIEDISANVDVGVIAARFHNALAGWSAVIAASSPLDDVVLAGGCFQNAHLTRRTRDALEMLGKTVHVPSRIPANDGGLAVGQLAIAMALWHQQQTEDNPCVSASLVASSTDVR